MRGPRFTITLTITDNHGFDKWTHAIGCDEALSISERAVDEMKAGVLPNMDGVVRIMKQREVRRELLVMAAERLAGQMADRLEDSEGWHDPSRIEPAKRALRGR
jgi:hypothetical protein